MGDTSYKRSQLYHLVQHVGGRSHVFCHQCGWGLQINITPNGQRGPKGVIRDFGPRLSIQMSVRIIEIKLSLYHNDHILGDYFLVFRAWADNVGRWPYSVLFFCRLDCLLKIKKIGVHMGTGKTFENVRFQRFIRTLTSTTYRLLVHTTHTVTPIDMTFCTYVQASVLYKIAIGTTKLRLQRFSAIWNFVKNTFLLNPPTA